MAPEQSSDHALSKRDDLDEDIEDIAALAHQRCSGTAVVGLDLVGGRFTLGRRLGVGGFGEVYEALDHDGERTVALKILSAPAIYRFKSEFRVAARMHHRNLVRLYQVFDEPRWFYTMELIHGRPFTDYVRGDLPAGAPLLDTSRLLGALAQLAEAMVYLHRDCRLLHRDLKPAAKNGALCCTFKCGSRWFYNAGPTYGHCGSFVDTNYPTCGSARWCPCGYSC